ncbi:Small auxin-up RNA [Sesbania bispinosa]|nr:Small auxin-up RNA [Sesbania bispinosa]
MGARASKLRKWVGVGGAIEGPVLAPRGYVPICVGTNEDTCRRYMVHTRALGDAFFCELLGRSAEEYGFRNEGVLRIPFEARDFEEWFIRRSNRKIKIKRVKPT